MELLQSIIDIVREAGQILLGAEHIEETVEEKSGRANYVTAYDKRVQDFLFEKLKEVLPEAVFIGEEEEEHSSLPEGYAFIIDPIDGTTNFMKGYCASCISVGLLKAKQPEIGVVYNPYLNEIFSAVKGKGAFKNGMPIHVSSHDLKDGIVLFGTAPYNEELAQKSFHCAYELFKKSLDVRRSGSAAIDLCNIACGRAELYFELLLSPWDYAAGSLILTEAGGEIMTTDGKALTYDRKNGIVAGNKKTLKTWIEL
ncbi:MAG: inositol monophosphatase family protein [Suilimivivens sp.]